MNLMKPRRFVLAPRVHISVVVRGANGITKARMDRPRPHGFANRDQTQKRRIATDGLRSGPLESGRTGFAGRRTRDEPGGAGIPRRRHFFLRARRSRSSERLL